MARLKPSPAKNRPRLLPLGFRWFLHSHEHIISLNPTVPIFTDFMAEPCHKLFKTHEGSFRDVCAYLQQWVQELIFSAPSYCSSFPPFPNNSTGLLFKQIPCCMRCRFWAAQGWCWGWSGSGGSSSELCVLAVSIAHSDFRMELPSPRHQAAPSVTRQFLPSTLVIPLPLLRPQQPLRSSSPTAFHR